MQFGVLLRQFAVELEQRFLHLLEEVIEAFAEPLHTKFGDLARVPLRCVMTEYLDLPADTSEHPGDRLDELALAIPLQPGDTEDLTGVDVDTESIDHPDATLVLDNQIFDAE